MHKRVYKREKTRDLRLTGEVASSRKGLEMSENGMEIDNCQAIRDLAAKENV